MKKTACLLALTVGLSLSLAAAPATATASPLIIILMENKSADQVNASPNMPYLQSFEAGGRSFSTFAEGDPTGPSLADYLQISAGSACGQTTNEMTPGGVPTSICPTTVWNQLESAEVSWGVYQDAMPEPCAPDVRYQNAALDTPYVLRHNPATPFASIWSDQELCTAHVRPFTDFDTGALPAVSFITPGICNDQHGVSGTPYTNCEPHTAALDKRGDDWLAARVPSMLAAGATVFITYDEGGDDLYAAEQGPGIAPSVDATPYTHYSLLAAIEDRYGLPRLGNATAASALPIGTGPPVITNLSPPSGHSGDPVTITGVGLAGASAVTFGGIDQPAFTPDADPDTSITTTVPAGGHTGPVCVTTPTDTGCSTSPFTVTDAYATPQVTDFSPQQGVVGTSVTITGAAFTGTTGVNFGGVDQPDFTVQTDTSITAAVPDGALSGPICVTNTLDTGCGAAAFTVTGPIAHVGQIGTAANTSGSPAKTLSLTVGPAGVPAGDTIVLGVETPSASVVRSATDQAGNTYHVDVIRAPGGTGTCTSALISAYVTQPLSSGQHITVRMSKGNAWGFVAEDWRGLAGTVDQTGSADPAGIANKQVSVSTAGAAAAGEAVIAVVCTAGQPAVTPDAGYTFGGVLWVTNGTHKSELAEVFRTAPAAGTQTATFTLSQSRKWSAAIATYG